MPEMDTRDVDVFGIDVWSGCMWDAIDFGRYGESADDVMIFEEVFPDE